jgi:hypothetical protein
LRQDFGTFTKTSLADDTDLDGFEAEAEARKKQGLAAF